MRVGHAAIALLGALAGCTSDSAEPQTPSMTLTESNETIGIHNGPDTVVFTDVGISGDPRNASWGFQGSAGADELLDITFEAGTELTIFKRDYVCSNVPYSLVVRLTHKGVNIVVGGDCMLTVNDIAASGETMSISLTGKGSPYLNDFVTFSAFISAPRDW